MSAEFVSGNEVRLLESGTAYFPALEAAIAAASREVHLETYIFADDITGRLIAAALAEAARRGVRVTLIVDGFGARGFAGGLGAPLAAAGVDVLVYRPADRRQRWRRNRLRRLHRKLAVIDGNIAFVGGINIIDDMDTPHQIPPRFDFAVEVHGPLVTRIDEAARHLGLLVSWAAMQRRVLHPHRRVPKLPPAGNVEAAFVIRDNVRHRRDIEEAYLEAIHTARREIFLANAYFLPGRRFRQALAEAARRGVSVIVLLQGRVEYFLLHHATQSLYAHLIGSGIRVFEYRRSFLHAKVAVIDGHWATVGSSNIDPFSLLLAREANVLVRNDEFAQLLRGCLQQAMDRGAVEVTSADIRRQSRLGRAMNWVAYSLVRLAIALTRYGGGDYRE